jgi:hypothetical protein
MVGVLTHARRIGIHSMILDKRLSGFAVGTREVANREGLRQFLALERVHQLLTDAETVVQSAVISR